MKSITLSIEGMTCSACSSGLEKYLNKQKGVEEASVNLIMATATIKYNDISKKDIEKYIKEAGFKSKGEFKYTDDLNTKRKGKIALIVYGILVVVLMYVSMGHMINLPVLKVIDYKDNPINYALFLFIITISFLIYGFDIIKNGFKNLIHMIPNMDTLITMGVISNFGYSLYGLINIIFKNGLDVHGLYFEATSMIIYFVKLGRYIESISRNKTKDAINRLVQITPKKAVVKRNGVLKTVDIDEINIGDVVVCRAGEKIAVDGVVLSGRTHVDESFITGESKPAKKGINDKVIAGSINYDGVIEYEAVKIGRDSTISEIVKLVVDATNTKGKMQKIADKASGYFVPILIGIAIITFVIYIVFGATFSSSINTFVTILVVACPCSLGLAVPLVIVVSNGICARSGIFVKNGESLELAQNIDTIVLDKTGTITYGKLKIFKLYNYSSLSENEIIKIVSSIEAKSTHPISSAFKRDDLKEVEGVVNIEGIGISGIVDDKKYYIGSRKILDQLDIKEDVSDDYDYLTQNGCSILYVIENNKIISLIGVKDKIRDNSAEFIRKAKSRNIDVIMLTGDNKKTANIIADEVSIGNVISDVMPNNKAYEIDKLLNNNRNVIMVGDGINDAPALVKSTIGIGINDGTDIAADSSDVILINNDLNSILDFIDIGKAAYKIIKQNLFWAFFYNICMVLIAIGIFKPFGIHINPMLGSLAMTFSSISVVLNSLRLNMYNKRR